MIGEFGNQKDPFLPGGGELVWDIEEIRKELAKSGANNIFMQKKDESGIITDDRNNFRDKQLSRG